jgi:hypothetical protein
MKDPSKALDVVKEKAHAEVERVQELSQIVINIDTNIIPETNYKK